MNKFTQLFKSRTFWTLAVMVAYNILNVYGHLLSPSLSDLVNLILGALVSYFHVNPSAVYVPAGQTAPTPGQSVVQIQP